MHGKTLQPQAQLPGHDASLLAFACGEGALHLRVPSPWFLSSKFLISLISPGPLQSSRSGFGGHVRIHGFRAQAGEQ